MKLAQLGPAVALLAIAASVCSLTAGCGHASKTRVTQTAAVGSASAPAPSVISARGSQPAFASRSDPVSSAAAQASAVPMPRIIWDPIPFGSRRKAQMVAYSRRHYGSFMTPTYRLIHPRVIVIHYTETSTFQATYNTFAPDVPDPELHELPNTCAHFVIDSAGGTHQLVSLGVMCRHTVGLNWTAIGVEHVGFGDRQVLNDRAQLTASLKLVRWLRCRYHIALSNVIGHNESLSSPYHREDVAALRTQTHADFNAADMRIYRRRLAALGACG